MVPECNYLKPGGEKCGSPALRSKLHCYFHDPDRRRSQKPPKARYFLELNSPGARRALAAALREVMQAFAAQGIESALAGRLLFALQLAISGKPVLDVSAIQRQPRGVRIVPMHGLGGLYATRVE